MKIRLNFYEETVFIKLATGGGGIDGGLAAKRKHCHY